MWLRSRYSWITDSHLVFSWLPLFRRCSVLRNWENAQDLEWPRADFTFSGARNGRLTIYLPLSSLAVVRKPFSSQVTSDGFATYTGSSSTSHNSVGIFSSDVSYASETLVDKVEIWFCLGAGTGPVWTHPKMISWPWREPQMFDRVPPSSMDGVREDPIETVAISDKMGGSQLIAEEYRQSCLFES